uniref:Uncharacterized protein n=1 Tax=Kalanchoe fedtschenkoi TaxID=63787 RepID=A0A7N0RE30_KALFE
MASELFMTIYFALFFSHYLISISALCVFFSFYPTMSPYGYCRSVCSLLLLVVSLSDAKPVELDHPAIFNFGDSNSDTGNIIAAGIGDPLDPPYGHSFFNAPAGRFSDGRLIIDFLADGLGKQFLNAYVKSVGAPKFQQGCNFAAAGSTVLNATSFSFCPFSFRIQVAQFARFKAQVVQILATNKTVSDYLPAESYFREALYTFDIGQNDLGGAFYSKTYPQVIQFIPTILGEFRNGIESLYNQGARNFWIHNTGPLGCLPQNIQKFGMSSSSLDPMGCLRAQNKAAKKYNNQLHALSTEFQNLHPDANLTYIDVFSIKSDLIANHSRYGFEEPIKACCGYGGGGHLNYDTRIVCGQTKILNGSKVTAKGCSNFTTYVNWDGIHYTEAANKHVASQILTGAYSHPPPVSMQLSTPTSDTPSLSTKCLFLLIISILSARVF